MKTYSHSITEDDIRDIAIKITDLLVGNGLIPDCTDTDDETEFDFQDQFFEIITESFTKQNQLNQIK
jgi:hypothetical protein